jgi:hypothetical protein
MGRRLSSRLERLAARLPFFPDNIAGSVCSRRTGPLKSNTATISSDTLASTGAEGSNGARRHGRHQRRPQLSRAPARMLAPCAKGITATALSSGLCAICSLNDGADAACACSTPRVTMSPVQPKLSPSRSEEGGYTPSCQRCILDGPGATVCPSTVRRAFAESTRSRGVTTISAKQIVSFTHLPPSRRTIAPAGPKSCRTPRWYVCLPPTSASGSAERQPFERRTIRPSPPRQRCASLCRRDHAFFTDSGEASASYRYTARKLTATSAELVRCRTAFLRDRRCHPR